MIPAVARDKEIRTSRSLERLSGLPRQAQRDGRRTIGNVRLADRGPVGIRLPGGEHDELLFRRRREAAGRLCLVRCERGPQHAPGRREEANAWGLYDMHGNVWEWCYEGDGLSDTERTGNVPVKEVSGVARGGSPYSTAWGCRSASRAWLEPQVPTRPPIDKRMYEGVRLVRSAEAGTARGEGGGR